MSKHLSDLITIVIPSKNEKFVVLDSLERIIEQEGIQGTKVIVADSSDEHFSKFVLTKLTKRVASKVDFQVIEGGYPSVGRRNGSLLVKTPYILFLDADIRLLDTRILSDIFEEKLMEKYDLLTSKISTSERYDWIFRWFDRFQKISIFLKSPFAVGSFQLWNTDVYWQVGGYNPEYIVAEDYAISKQVSPKRFGVLNTKKVWTSPRRFKKKGLWYMIKLMTASYLNRNNSDFFKKDHDYWK